MIRSRRSRSRSKSSNRSSASSRSSSPEMNSKESSSHPPKTKSKETFDDLFKKTSNTSYYLAQKSEVLMFDQIKESESNTEQFVWRKKNQKIGLDKLDPQRQVLLNQLKREETEVRS